MNQKKLLVFIFAFWAIQAKAGIVSGTVTDSHQPIPFCSVYLKGTTVGTSANSEGHYFLDVVPGDYEIVFRSIGYQLNSKKISVGIDKVELNIELVEESYLLKEAVVNASAEDPAYGIMRKAIKMRKKYLDEVNTFSCRSYVKSTQKLLEYPKKFLGQEVKFGDFLDTLSGIFYLSESVANLSFKKPDKIKEEMISSKVSGRQSSFSFNKSSDLLVNFYQNLITLGNLSPRGIVSPVSVTAMLYYDYRLEGTFIQNGETVNKIKVIPKRKHDPVFSGDIYILDDSWRIHSLDLFITKDQQIEFIDTFRISETYVPVEKNIWMMLNSEFKFEFSLFGFRGRGLIIGVFNDYNIHPDFPAHFFNNEVMKINRDANKKDTVYWEKERPAPLTPEENRDYEKRDSLYIVHNTKEYMDSMDVGSNKFSFTQYLIAGYSTHNSYRNSTTSFAGPLQNIQFNTAEGWALTLSGRYSKSISEDVRKNFSVIAESRYGFSNKHLNGNLMFVHKYNSNNFGTYFIKGGSGVYDFNGRSGFSRLVNTGYTLLARKNWLKLYEKRFGYISHRFEVVNGLVINTGAEFAERIPLINTTDFSWISSGIKYLSNDPEHQETDTLHFQRNQSFIVDLQARIRFGQKYVMRPEGKSIIGSRYPELSIIYKKAIPGVAGSGIDYDLVQGSISDEIRMGLFGGVRYSFSYGKFLRTGKMELMDYHHFNGNKTIFSDFALSDFGILDYYRFASNKEYAEVHGEYNMGGLILNKIPLIRSLNLNEIVGAHYLFARYSNTTIVKNYYETSFGIEKLGLLRADFVLGFEDSGKVRSGIVIGLKLKISNGSVRIIE